MWYLKKKTEKTVDIHEYMINNKSKLYIFLFVYNNLVLASMFGMIHLL